LIFKSHEKLLWGGEEKLWKAKSHNEIWIEGNTSFRLSEDFAEMRGNWVPNPGDKQTARRAKD